MQSMYAQSTSQSDGGLVFGFEADGRFGSVEEL